MITHHLPLVSSTAGDLSDGSIIGAVNQSSPFAVLQGESLVTIAQVLVKDVTSTGSTLTDVTTAATNATTGDFNPFGTLTTMSLGDAFYFRTASNVDTHVFYAQISTAGVGTWGMDVQEYSTVTDAWQSVVGLVDTSDGFKAGVGTYKISYTSGTEGLVRLDDSYGYGGTGGGSSGLSVTPTGSNGGNGGNGAWGCGGGGGGGAFTAFTAGVGGQGGVAWCAICCW